MAKPRRNKIYNCDYIKFWGKNSCMAIKTSSTKSEGKWQAGKGYLQPIKVYIPNILEKETQKEETNILIEKRRKILIACRERTDVTPKHGQPWP